MLLVDPARRRRLTTGRKVALAGALFLFGADPVRACSSSAPPRSTPAYAPSPCACSASRRSGPAVRRPRDDGRAAAHARDLRRRRSSVRRCATSIVDRRRRRSRLCHFRGPQRKWPAGTPASRATCRRRGCRAPRSHGATRPRAAPVVTHRKGGRCVRVGRPEVVPGDRHREEPGRGLAVCGFEDCSPRMYSPEVASARSFDSTTAAIAIAKRADAGSRFARRARAERRAPHADVAAGVDRVVADAAGLEQLAAPVDRPALDEPGRVDGPHDSLAGVEVAAGLLAQLVAAGEHPADVGMAFADEQLAAVEAADLAVVLVRAEACVDLAEPVEQLVEQRRRRTSSRTSTTIGIPMICSTRRRPGKLASPARCRNAAGNAKESWPWRAPPGATRARRPSCASRRRCSRACVPADACSCIVSCWSSGSA